MSAMLLPMSLLASSAAIKTYGTAILGGIGTYAAEWGSKFNVETPLATAIIIGSFGLSIVGVLSSIWGAVIGFRNREMFV